MFTFAQTVLVGVCLHGDKTQFSCVFWALFLIYTRSKGFVFVNRITLWVNIFVIDLTTISLISMYQRQNKFVMFVMIKQVNILNTFNAAWFKLISLDNVSTVLIKGDITLKRVTQSTQQYVYKVVLHFLEFMVRKLEESLV